jgi:alcohol dehydrogenase
MKAAYIRQYGKQEKLVIGELPAPTVGDTDVLIKVHAASVNPVDIRLRDGALRLIRKYRFPLILGHDLAGVVVQAGKSVTRFKPGDEVFSRPSRRGIGTFAELIAVDESEVALKPKNLSFAEAASLPLVALTSRQALVDIANIKPGQRVLVHAGSGGVGSIAIQLAKHMGAVVTTTTSARNVELAKSLGADVVIDYTKQDFAKVAGEQDMVFSTLEGDTLTRSFDLIAPGGVVVSIAGTPDPVTARELGLGWLLRTMLGIMSYGPTAAARKRKATYRFLFMKASGAQLEEIAKLVEQNHIRPVIDKVYALDDAQKAIEHSESGRARGKIVVEVD